LSDGGSTLQAGSLSAGFVNIAVPAGFYSLDLTDDYGYSVLKNVEVHVKQQVDANLRIIHSRKYIRPGDEVFFSDESTGADSNEWDFGDGFVLSNIPQPSHTYLYSGVYDVTLRTWNDDCEDLVENSVSVGMPPVIRFFPFFSSNFKSADLTEVNEADELYIYGSAEFVFVEFKFKEKTNAQLHLYDITGKQLHSEKIVTYGIQKISVDGLSSAVYFVKVVTPEKTFSNKVLLEAK